MADPTTLHVQTHKQLNDLLEPYHEKLNDIDGQIARLNQSRATVHATLIHELNAHGLKLPQEAIGALAARCW